MKKVSTRILISIVLINIAVFSFFLIPNGYCATKEINSNFGESPSIDGQIDFSSKEWNKAAKVSINLGGLPPTGLPISLWVMQDDSNLYISVQLELAAIAREETEFIGLIISNSSSENDEDFIDAKLIQFSNISENNFNYLDYKINNSIFLPDTDNDGAGAAKLEGLTSIYEFSIPINNYIGNDEDAVLEFGNTYAFNITYGENPVYPEGIIKSTIVLINIKSITTTVPINMNIIFYVVCLIVFSILGIFLGFYIFNIFRLKKNLERFKR